MRPLISKSLPIIRTFGYLIGLSLLVYQGYRGILAISQGFVIFPGWGPSLIALLLSILALACQILAWWVMMKGLRTDRLLLKDMFWGYTLSFLPRYIPGTIWGYMSRGDWLKANYAVAYKTSTFGSITELALMAIVNIILSSLLFLPDFYTKLIFIVVLILLLLIITISFRNIRFVISGLMKSTYFVNIIASTLLLFCTWFFYGFSLFSIAEPNNAFHFLNYNRLFLYVCIYSAGWLIGFLILFVPAGMGVRELALSHLLTTYALIGAQTSNGLAVYLRIIVTTSELCWLILGFIVKKLSFSKGEASNSLHF